MSSLGLVQIFINICLGVGIGFLWIRVLRPAKDDPRMSRGLQLLQSKISVLEDLSDRTDQQVKQLTLLLDEKARLVQRQMEAAQEQVQNIDQSMKRSREVARIFQDKIPHEEIIERQNTVKYVRAAQLAHQGLSSQEIAAQVDLPESEIELIAKVNRERLVFTDETLPDWVREEVQSPAGPHKTTALERAQREAFEPPPPPASSLAQIGAEFRKAVQAFQSEEIDSSPLSSNSQQSFKGVPHELVEPPVVVEASSPEKGGPSAKTAEFQPIRPYTFPRVTRT